MNCPILNLELFDTVGGDVLISSSYIIPFSFLKVVTDSPSPDDGFIPLNTSIEWLLINCSSLLFCYRINYRIYIAIIFYSFKIS